MHMLIIVLCPLPILYGYNSKQGLQQFSNVHVCNHGCRIVATSTLTMKALQLICHCVHCAGLYTSLTWFTCTHESLYTVWYCSILTISTVVIVCTISWCSPDAWIAGSRSGNSQRKRWVWGVRQVYWSLEVRRGVAPSLQKIWGDSKWWNVWLQTSSRIGG